MNNILHKLKKQFPNDLINIRDKSLYKSLEQQLKESCDEYRIGLDIARLHPLVDGNKRFGFSVSFMYRELTIEQVTHWFRDFDSNN